MPDFAIWPECNIGCVFCSNPVEGFRDTAARYSFEDLRSKLEEYKSGFRRFLKFDEVGDFFNLTGGEPTLHPEFLRVLALVRTEFPGRLIRLLTNGRMFAYEDFTRRAFGIGGLPFEAAIPLFGYDAKTHEAIARAPGSFEQTVAGLANVRRLRRPGQGVEIRVILTRIQMRWLEGLLEYVLRELAWTDRLVLLFEELEGFAQMHAGRLALPMSECAEGLDRVYPLLARFREVRLYHFPLCVVPTRLWPFVYNTLAPLKVEYLAACGECLYRDACVGVHRSYVRHTGAPDIRAIRAARSVALSGDRYHPVSEAWP